MCIVVYLSTNLELEEHKGESLRVERINDTHADLPTPPLRFKHQYYLGSHQGCGCGFLNFDATYQELITIPDLTEYALDSLEPDERERSQQSNSALFELLKQCLSKSTDAELWVTWSGDQTKVPQVQLELNIRGIDPSRFFLTEGHRYQLTMT